MSDFDKWMKRVDLMVFMIAGVSVHDLPDCPFRDWYEDGTDPKRAARKALARAGFRS